MANDFNFGANRKPRSAGKKKVGKARKGGKGKGGGAWAGYTGGGKAASRNYRLPQ